jgi:hypothetical protein
VSYAIAACVRSPAGSPPKLIPTSGVRYSS